MEIIMAVLWGGSIVVCGLVALRQYNKEYPPKKEETNGNKERRLSI